jgi:TfoX/Sxy family transcriptional regulator of competence genes
VNKLPLTPEERFADLVDDLAANPEVTPPIAQPSGRRRFGASELKTHGKIFALLSQGRLVVKLPRVRVDALAAAGEGERWDPRRDGRQMKEWVSLAPTYTGDWLPLAQEALDYVVSQR